MTDERPAAEVTRKPPLASSGVAVGALLLGTLASGLYDPVVIAGGLGGALAVGGGLAVGSRRAITVGAALALAGLLVAGTRGLPAIPLLTTAIAFAVGWDAGHHAIGVGEQLGRDPETIGAELPHVGATALVGIVVAGGSYAVYRAGPGGLPVAAVLFLLIGAIALLAVLEP